MESILYFTEFLISKRLHVGILAFIVAVFYMRILGIISYNPVLPLISFLIVWGAYLENLTTDKKEDAFNTTAPHGIASYIESKLFPIETLYPFFYISALFLSLFISVKCFIYSLISVLLYMSYVHRWIPWQGKKKRLKEFFIIKNVIPPLCWLFSVGIVPLSGVSNFFIPEHLLFAFIVILWAYKEEVKFDIPDADGDKKAGIKTLPNTLGKIRTKIVLNTINYIVVSSLFSALLLLRINNHMSQFDSLLRNIFPLLIAQLSDGYAVDVLLEKEKKEYCNLADIWKILLLGSFLLIRYPYNIYVYLFLSIAGSFFAYSTVDKYLLRISSKRPR